MARILEMKVLIGFVPFEDCEFFLVLFFFFLHVTVAGEQMVVDLHDVLMNGLPSKLRCKESACSAGDPSLIPGSGRSPGERNDKGAWQAIVHEVESWTQLSD